MPDSLAKKKMNRKTVAILLTTLPTALIIISVMLYAISNFIMVSTSPDGLFQDPSPFQVIFNILLFILTTIGILAWLPGLIAGIILVATKKK